RIQPNLPRKIQKRPVIEKWGKQVEYTQKDPKPKKEKPKTQKIKIKIKIKKSPPNFDKNPVWALRSQRSKTHKLNQKNVNIFLSLHSPNPQLSLSRKAGFSEWAWNGMEGGMDGG
ncbi:hypothetical protein TorRG33x02_121790, partial [Trema orientale]